MIKLVGLALVALLATSIEAGERKVRQLTTVTQTSTATSTAFTTITSTTRTVCVKYVNATSACRRKRQFWIDTPIVLGLDEDLDPYAQQFLNPSPVLAVQPTRHPIFKQSHPAHVAVFPVQPSIGLKSSALPNPYLFRSGLSPYQPLRPFDVHPFAPTGNEGRLGAVGLLNLFAQALGVAPTTTVTSTTTVTKPTTTFVSSTGTLLISGCSPPGITYSAC